VIVSYDSICVVQINTSMQCYLVFSYEGYSARLNTTKTHTEK
jgi:hypothetical protein